VLSSGLARSRKQAPKKPVQAAHCRPLWTVAREVRHLPLEIEAEAQASWPLARVGSSAKSREGSNAHAASGFRLRLDTTNQDAVLQWAQFHRWSPRTRIMRAFALSAGQRTPAPREPSPGIRASLLTQAKFFQHERSYRSPRGDTQTLRLSAILASTFYPPGHCYA